MSTIRDVARRAGVSTMTVSRVINNSGYISQEARERVERAIADLNYIPNALARSLRFKQTKTIALILTDITNPFFTTLARGVEDVANEHGFSVLFCNTDESQDAERAYLNVLVQKQVDGMLLVPASATGESVTMLQARGVPVVLLDRRLNGVSVDTVRCDSLQGAYALVRHLLGLGHRRVAVISGPPTASTAVDRVAGYTRAMDEAGIGPAGQIIRFGEYSEAGGQRMAGDLLSLSPRPTAIFAANNFIAFGALRALRDAGVAVPGDISLVTFDDISQLVLLEPVLTAMAQPAYELGRRATELLLSRLAGDGPPGAQEIVLPTTMTVRSSSAPPAVA